MNKPHGVKIAMAGNTKKRTILVGGKRQKKAATPRTKRAMNSDSQIISKAAGDTSFSKPVIDNADATSQKHYPETFKLKSAEGKQKPINLSRDNAVEFLSEQVDAYYEISKEIDAWSWNAKDIIDQLHVFSRALNFETATLALINKDGDKFERFVSRGNYAYPGAGAISHLEEAIDSGRLNWDKLIEQTSQKGTPYINWIESEEFEYVGLVPIHDGHTIIGFILTASRKEVNPSEIASKLLELLSGRLGMTISLGRK